MMPPSRRRLGSISAALTSPSSGGGLSAQRQAEAVASPSSVTLTIDLDATPGMTWGNIVVPWSDDRGAWANKLIPICVINGPLPAGATEHAAADSALLFAGNHGKSSSRRPADDHQRGGRGRVLLSDPSVVRPYDKSGCSVCTRVSAQVTSTRVRSRSTSSAVGFLPRTCDRLFFFAFPRCFPVLSNNDSRVYERLSVGVF